ncbi:magnesium transporter NIPA-domain-containing protein [Mycena rebaudengoi]|nr:magnesium transporter NIPA-domain-containing protein [Mycena rebaudengoi]
MSSASPSPSPSPHPFGSGKNLKVRALHQDFVFKKKGLLRAQAGHAAGEGVAYLKSPLWWLGMTMMILGELCNFAAYAFVEAIVVTPLGALSVVVCAILSSIFLKEELTFFGWLGCSLCILGSVIIALNGPSEASVGQIKEFQKLFLSVGFLIYGGILITAALGIIFFAAPRWGKKSMLWYIFVVTTGLGAAIVTTAGGDNQFKHWFMYFLLGFVIITLLTEVYYLNVALALFNTVTFFSIVTTIVLFKGLSASVSSIITLVMGFLVICVGITILQMSKGGLGLEDPGMDALRGSFGTVGSIIRARSARRLSQASSAGRPPGAGAPYDRNRPTVSGLQRHQLYDAPMPGIDLEATRSQRSDSNATAPRPGVAKRTTIKFDAQDVVHQYHPTSPGFPHRDESAIHMQRPALESPGMAPSALPDQNGYPPRTRADTEPLGGTGLASLRSGSRDLLLDDETKDSPQSGTLLSFPSVTDSARSANWEDGAGSTGTKHANQSAGERQLVQKSGRDSPAESAESEPSVGGIRLVQPRF